MNRHRCERDIVADMLSVVRQEPKKTHIMFGANLSYSLLSKYLEKLVVARLIRYRKSEMVYELTEKGLAYLNMYAECEELRSQLQNNQLVLSTKEAGLSELLLSSS